jgi:uncharacterized protein YndB with AHSA1/START domain
MSFTNFSTSSSHLLGGKFLKLVPNERSRWTDPFDDPNLPGVMTTVEIKAVPSGTELHVTQEGIPDVMSPNRCSVGGQQLLTRLQQLVAPEILDGQ